MTSTALASTHAAEAVAELPTEAEIERRRAVVREGIASAAIEGGQVSLEAQSIMGAGRGRRRPARIKALHGA